MKKIKFKKLKSMYSFVIFILFIIAILFFIIKVIIGLFVPEEKYDISNIEQYIQNEEGSGVDETKLVKSYTNFHLIQEILEQFIDALINNKYEETYKLLDSEMLSKYKNKDEYITKIKEFTSDNFIIKDPDILFLNRNKLKKLYVLSNIDYLAEYETINGDIKKIGIRLDTKQQKYKIFYIEM